MVSAFLGTLIALERAVALHQRWMYVGPMLTGLAGITLIVGWGASIGATLITLGSLGFVGIMIVIIRRQLALYTAIMFLGVLFWLIGNLLWLFGFPIYRIVLWWMTFLILTIVAERLELGRLTRLPRTAEALFIISASIFLLGTIISVFAFDLGARIGSLGSLALSLWLLRFDVARHTIHQKGLPRFAASCLMAGFVWLGISGALGLLSGGQTGGLKYDALLHTVFIGFVISMIFGHAPIIFPSILNLPIRYMPAFYVHLVLLHLSLMMRITGDLIVSVPLHMWGGLLNGVAILIFLILTAYSIASSRKQNVSPPSEPART